VTWAECRAATEPSVEAFIEPRNRNGGMRRRDVRSVPAASDSSGAPALAAPFDELRASGVSAIRPAQSCFW
jgi:hypothetical protein